MPALSVLTSDPPARRHTARRSNLKATTTADLCAAYLAAERSFCDFGSRVSAAHDVANKAAPTPRELREALKLPEFSYLDGKLDYVMTNHIRAAVDYLEKSQTRRTGDDKNFTIEYREGGFPLTDNQKTRLAELRALLAISEKHDADRSRAHDESGHTGLTAECDQMGTALFRLRCRIIGARSNTPADLQGKIAIYRKDACDDLAASIIDDAARLLKSGVR